VAGDVQPMVMLRELRPMSPLPGLLAPAVPHEVVPADRAMAARIAHHLFTSTPDTYDRDLVQDFQRAEGLNATGAYGPATALALVPYGLVPPKPFYWPRKGLLHAKTAYRVTLLAQSKRDAQRADEWSAASNV
jgi:hypothetical protein